MPDIVFLVGSFLFQHFESIIPLPLACKVSAKKSTDNLMLIPLHVMYCFVLPVFNILFLCLSFDSLITMCLGMGLFEFILLGSFKLLDLDVHFFRFGKYSSIISSSKLSVPSSLFSFWNFHNMYFVLLDGVLYVLLFFFTYILFIFTPLTIISTCLQVH